MHWWRRNPSVVVDCARLIVQFGEQPLSQFCKGRRRDRRVSVVTCPCAGCPLEINSDPILLVQPPSLGRPKHGLKRRKEARDQAIELHSNLIAPCRHQCNQRKPKYPGETIKKKHFSEILPIQLIKSPTRTCS